MLAPFQLGYIVESCFAACIDIQDVFHPKTCNFCISYSIHLSRELPKVDPFKQTQNIVKMSVFQTICVAHSQVSNHILSTCQKNMLFLLKCVKVILEIVDLYLLIQFYKDISQVGYSCKPQLVMKMVCRKTTIFQFNGCLFF